jgi:hypothetical protein
MRSFRSCTAYTTSSRRKSDIWDLGPLFKALAVVISAPHRNTSLATPKRLRRPVTRNSWPMSHYRTSTTLTSLKTTT